MGIDSISPDMPFIDEFDKSSVNADEFAVVILAAGLSNRMGDVNKLLLNIDGQSLLRRCVAVVEEAGVGETIVVLGHDRENTERELAKSGVQSVLNMDYESGQMSSVQCGLNAVSGSKKATMICLADQPLISALHLQNLMWAYENKSRDKQIVVPMCQNKRGNPVMISETVRKAVLQQEGSPSCRRYIDRNPELVYWVSFDEPAFVTDIDTPDEYAALCDSNTKIKKNQNNQDTIL